MQIGSYKEILGWYQLDLPKGKLELTGLSVSYGVERLQLELANANPAGY